MYINIYINIYIYYKEGRTRFRKASYSYYLVLKEKWH